MNDTIEQAKPVEAKPEVVPVPVFEYDAPPKGYVAGTKVPKDTLPEDMTDAEYIEWMYENLTPFWAIKRNMLLRKPPVLSGLEPSTAEIGTPGFDLKVSGAGLIMDSVIVFAGQDEPTQLNADGTVSTGINMDVWHNADVVEVRVRNGTQLSEPLDFTFTAAPESDALGHDDGDEDAGHDDEGKPVRRKKHRK